MLRGFDRGIYRQRLRVHATCVEHNLSLSRTIDSQLKGQVGGHLAKSHLQQLISQCFLRSRGQLA
jgi:hypothetical protein